MVSPDRSHLPPRTFLLTDSPEVVRLKREFRLLDDLEERLKWGRESMVEGREPERLEAVRVRKSEIAREIFLMGQ